MIENSADENLECSRFSIGFANGLAGQVVSLKTTKSSLSLKLPSGICTPDKLFKDKLIFLSCLEKSSDSTSVAAKSRWNKKVDEEKDAGSSYSDIIQQLFRTYDVVPQAYLHSEFGSAIIALVKKGLGIALLPDSYIYQEIPGIRFITLPHQTDLFLNWRVNDRHPVLNNVLDLILH